MTTARRHRSHPYPRALEPLATRLSGHGPLAASSPGAGRRAWCSVTAAGNWLTADGRRAVGELVAARAGVADP